LDGLKADADRVYEYIKQYFTNHPDSNLMTQKQLLQICQQKLDNISIQDVELLITYLTCKKEVYTRIVDGVKYLSVDSDTVNNDDNIDKLQLEMKLQDVQNKLSHKLNEIDLKISHEKKMALSYLQNNNQKSISLIHMKRKKSLENMYVKVAGQLQTLDKMIHTIDMAKSNREIHSTMLNGRKILEDINLDSDRIKEDLKDITRLIDEVDSVSETLGSKTSTELEDLENELYKLLNESTTTTTTTTTSANIADQLPSAPTTQLPDIATSAVDEMVLDMKEKLIIG